MHAKIVGNLVLLGIFLYLYGPKHFGYLGTAESTELVQYFEEEDPCESTARCVYVYVTPWCPHCHSSVPLIKDMTTYLRSHEDIGLKVIIGRDSDEKLDAFADQFNEAVYLDPSGSFFSSIGGGGVPRWLSTDNDGNVLAEQSGSPTGAPNPELIDHLINKLGVDDYL